METKTFKQVFIHSEADNPKESGIYLTEFGWLRYDGKWHYPQNENTTYLRRIDWYLAERPSQPDKGKAEEIFHKFCNNLINDEYRIRDKKGFIKAIDDFARSKPDLQTPEISDEEIGNGILALSKLHAKSSVGDWAVGYITGAKFVHEWYKSELSKRIK